MSGLPAMTVGLVEQKRGLIKEGFFADILVFDSDHIKDMATFENPHELASGFDRVIINGKNVRSEGEFTEQRPGKMLRKR
mgnify:FL=1